VRLFQATVRDNLTFFNAEITDSQILTALEDLGLLDWCQALPDGLDTVLASGGGLSAGQAQLLALVRAFLANPSLVILDEASSRLDPATERHLDQAIGRLLRGRTAMIIAHRLGTLRKVDEILVLEQGRILEHGSRTALAADPTSRFARLLRTEEYAAIGAPQEVLS
jgi:ABC-type multidrug transport system fused ATPase/permease subunit